MREVTVYGASDDLIELEGAVVDEFSALDDDGEGTVVAFSDGTALRVVYTPSGVWRVHLVTTGEGSDVKIEPCPEGDDDNYSDRAVITPAREIRWAVAAPKVSIARAWKG